MNASSDTVRTSAPTIAVFGCGGAGINLTRQVRAEFGTTVITEFYDTSTSNLLDGETATIIKHTGSGSGMHRHENVEQIHQELHEYTKDQLPIADINVLMFSLAGGSGNVIATLMASEIARRKDIQGKEAQVVAYGVIDLTSKKAVDNVHRSMQTLVSIAEAEAIYLPMTLFDNSLHGRNSVDAHLIQQIGLFIHLMTMPTFEIDRNDRRGFLNRGNHLNLAPGLRVLHVASGVDGGDTDLSGEIFSGCNGQIFDATLKLNTETETDNSVLVPFDALVSYEGRFSVPKLVPLLGVVGSDHKAFDDLNRRIDDRLTKFSAHDTGYKAPVKVAPDAQRKSKIIL